jgi:Flp pilus assembly protein TadD
MSVQKVRRYFFVFAVLFVVSLLVGAQANGSASGRFEGQEAAANDQKTTVDRQKAMALFQEGKRLEALPALEELATKNPKDSDVLVALAASLIAWRNSEMTGAARRKCLTLAYKDPDHTAYLTQRECLQSHAVTFSRCR